MDSVEFTLYRLDFEAMYWPSEGGTTKVIGESHRFEATDGISLRSVVAGQ